MKFNPLLIKKIINEYLHKGTVRSVKAKKNIAWTLLIKVASFGIQLLIVPLSLKYVDPEGYGIWITLSSIIAWFALFDFGLQNGLRNRLAESIAVKDYNKARYYLSTTYALLTLIIIALAGIFFSVNFFINWADILNAPEAMATELKSLAFITFGFFCLQFVFKTITVVLISDQNPAFADLLIMLSQLMALILVAILAWFTHKSLLLLGLVMSATPVFIFLIGSTIFLKKRYKEYMPSTKFIHFKYARSLFSIGYKFLILQIAYMGIFQTNSIIIAQVCSHTDVTIYNIALKYMGIISVGFTIFIFPLWSAFTEAYTLKDYAWMKGTFQKLNIFSILPMLAAILMILLSDYFYKLWIGDTVEIPLRVTLFMGVYIVFQLLVSMYTSVLNGIGKVFLELRVYTISVLIHVPLAIILTSKWGIIGALISGIVFMIVIFSFSHIQVRKIINRKESGIWNK